MGLRRLPLVGFAILALSAASRSSLAQTTGNIEGQVTDPSGAAVVGAVVEATSPALQGTRVAATGDDGRFRIPAVPPGTYAVKASLAGFATEEKTAYVTLGATATVSFALEIASLFEEIQVREETPTIDLTSTTTGSSFTAEVLERMSIGRNYADIALSQPGVLTDTADNLAGLGERVVNLAVQGATSLENLYVIDGVNTTNVLRGFQGKAINPETMQEVQIKTGGYQAEYGRALGGVINVVTKSGGNEFHGDAFAYYNSKSMREETEITERNILAAEKTEVDRWDAGVDLGGYIVRDRLWFFTSYDRLERDTIRIPQAGPVAGQSFLLRSTADTYSGKLTWNIAQGSTLVGSLFADPEEKSGAVNLPSSTFPSTYTANRQLGGEDYTVRWNQLFGSRGILTLQASRHSDRFETEIPREAEQPRIADRTVPGVTVFSGGFGNINAVVNHSSTRDGYAASYAAYLADHEIKFGGDYEDNATAGTTRRTGGQVLTIQPCKPNPQSPASVDRCLRAGGVGAPYVNWRGDSVPGGVVYQHAFLANLDGTPVLRIDYETPSLAYSAYLQDNWRVSSRLTANAGIRWDREEIRNFEDQTVIDLENMWSPRAGLVWDFLGDGTSKLFGSLGRFYYQFPTDLNFRAYGRDDFLIISAANYDPASLVHNPRTPFAGSIMTPFGDEPRDANLKGMYQDEFALGAEKAITPTFVVGLRASYHRLGRVIEDRCDLDYLHPENHGHACAIINPGSAERYARGDFPCTNRDNERPDAAAFDAVCNEAGGPPIEDASRIYRALELNVRLTVNDRLWTVASYIFSSLRGNYDGAARLESGQSDPGVNADFDYFHFYERNAYGRLYLDRPHSFQIGATYLTPFGLTAGLSTYVRSGPPRNKGEFFNSGYVQEIFGARRGTAGRADPQYEANVSLAYDWQRGPVTITPRIYVYNLLNRQGGVRLQDAFNPDGAFDASGNAVQHPDYGKIRERQEPRLFRVALKVSF